MANIIIGLFFGLVIGVAVLYLYIPKVAMKKIDSFLDALMSSNETVRDFLTRTMTEPESKHFINELKKNLSTEIYRRISERSVSDGAAKRVVAQVCAKLSSCQAESKPSQGLIDRKKEEIKNKIRGHAETVIESNKGLIEGVLSSKMNEVITRDMEGIVFKMVNQEIDNILSRPVSSLFQGNEKTISELKRILSSTLLGKKCSTH